MFIYEAETFYKRILKLDEETIEKTLDEREQAYYTFEIPKKNGFRKINAIKEGSNLYILQNNLYKNFISKNEIPTCVKGFKKGESYRTFLEPHKGNKFYLKIDLTDFFGSITEEHIQKMLVDNIRISKEETCRKIVYTIVKICSLHGSLPQGAITSPGISNLVFARLDQRILKYCQRMDIIYTRYADDIIFSSKEFDFNKKTWFLRTIKKILASSKFHLNYHKKKISNDSIAFNGFIISDEIRLSRKRFSDINIALSNGRNGLDILKIKGEEEYIKYINTSQLKFRSMIDNPFDSLSQFIQYLAGYRSFFISWIDDYVRDSCQKRIRKTINRIERLIIDISN